MIWLNESIQSSRKQDPPLSEQIKNCFIFLDRAEALVGDDDPVHFYACASNNLHDNTKLSNNVPFSKKTDSVLKATCVHSLHVMHAARACENIPGLGPVTSVLGLLLALGHSVFLHMVGHLRLHSLN
jgi:hypothetical protein